MCGIIGCCDDHIAASAFETALDSLAHRGPDDKGVFEDRPVWLGHRRLSIIDLSAAGHQPMRDDATGNWIVFNGEIYNYIELRTQLKSCGYTFKTETDTEVLINAYNEWGTGCLKRLNGMWAFAIYEPGKKRIFVARDRFGVKPFYFTKADSRFAFSSEPKALLVLYPELRSVNPKAMYEFLEMGLLYTSHQSFYKGIDLLPPAHFGFYNMAEGSFAVHQYWSFPDPEQRPAGVTGAPEEFAALFDDATKIRLRSDVPVGVTLSGGLDSSAVLAASMKTEGAQRICFTSVYSETQRGEAEWAMKATAPYGIRPVEVKAPLDAWAETLSAISWHMDAPGYSPAVFPLWHLMKRARQDDIPVLLEGQGADEAFGGYPQYGVLDFLETIQAGGLSLSGEKLREMKVKWHGLIRTFSRKWVVLWMLRETFPFLIRWNRKRVGAGSVLKKGFVRQAKEMGAQLPMLSMPNGYDAVTRRLFSDFSAYILPGLLHYGDAISMAHSIESRLPFLDYRLIEWIFSNPADVKISQGETKWVLRQYLRQNGLKAIGNRPDKLGYPTPFESWLAQENGRLPREYLLSGESRIHDFCDPDSIERLISQHVRGRNGIGNHLYRLLSTEFWLRACIDSGGSNRVN